MSKNRVHSGILTILLALIMALSMMPIGALNAYADDPTTVYTDGVDGTGWIRYNSSYGTVDTVKISGVSVEDYNWESANICSVVLDSSTAPDATVTFTTTLKGGMTSSIYSQGREKYNGTDSAAGQTTSGTVNLSDGSAKMTIQPRAAAASWTGTLKTFNITTSDGVLQTFDVNLTSGDGYTIVPVGDSVSPVEKKGSFTFQVNIAEGYKRGADFAVKVNGEKVDLDENNQYTISNIREEQNVTVEDVVTSDTVNKFRITLTEADGMTYEMVDGSSTPVDEGSDFKFRVSFATGYIPAASFAVNDNGLPMTAVDGVYTLPNVNAHHTITITGVIRLAAVTAPTGSTVKAGYENGEWTYYWYDPAITENKGDGTTVYWFNPITSGKPFFRVQNPNGATYWNFESMAGGAAYTVTMDDLTKNGTFEKDTIYHDFYYNYLDLGDIYLTLNEKGYISLANGGTKALNAFRNWQAINSFTNDMIAIPDFHYEVVDINGDPSDLVTVSTNANNSGIFSLNAKSSGSGLAIVKVTYDAMIHMDGYASGYGAGGADSTRLGAIWPECTGIIVVSVGDSGTKPSLGMTINTQAPLTHAGKVAGNNIDAEHDLLYYYGDEGAEYTFKPEEGSTVSIARCTLGTRDLSFSGFTTDGVATDDEGNVTVSGLTAGRHIVKVEKDGAANYQVLSARQITIEVKDKDDNVVNDWKTRVFEPGDELTFKMHNVNSPQEKLSQCYNCSFKVAYFDENSTKMASSMNGTEHGYGQYNFSSLDNYVTMKIPDDWTVKHTIDYIGAVELAGGYTGAAAGGHRSKAYGGASGGAQGTPGAGVFGALPSFTLNVNSKSYVKTDLTNPVTRSAASGEAFTLDLSTVFTDDNGDDLTYKVAIDDADPVAADKDYSVSFDEAGVYELVFTANDGIADSKDTYKVVLKVGQENTAPNRKAGVPEEEVVVLDYNAKYELDLATIFEDADDDYLSYKVAVNGADPVDTPVDFSCVADTEKIKKLVFTANDGTENSTDTYIVKLKANIGFDPAVYWDYTVDGNGWYGRGTGYCYVQMVKSTGVKVKNFEWTNATTCDIELISATESDAEFDFTVTNYKRSSGTNGVRINGTEYTGDNRTVQIALADGQAAVTVQPYGYNTTTASYQGTTKTFNFRVAEPAPNSKPVLADGVESETSAEIRLGEQYSIDLAPLFSDPDGDGLLYTVSVNDAEPVSAAERYKYTPSADGTAKLVFRADDGKDESEDTYTVNLTVDHAHEWGEWHIKTAPTATTPGEKERECSICHEKETEAVPAYGEEKVKIDILAQVKKNTLEKVYYSFEVSSEDAGKYGYSKPEAFWGKVTMADVCAALHYDLYGEDFAANPTDYLKINDAGTTTMIFGEATYMNGFKVNDKTPEYPDQPGTGSLWNDTPIKTGDKVRIFQVHGEYYGLMESYLMFDKGQYTGHAGGSVEVTVTGDLTFGTMMSMPEDVQPVEDATVALVTDYRDPAGSKVAEAATDEDGVAEFDKLEPGEYDLVVIDYENDYGEDCFSTPYAKVTVADHSWGEWTIVEPTLDEAGSKTRTCSECGKVETQEIPKLTKVSVDFTSQMMGGFLHAPQKDHEVISNLAESYGYADAVNGVSALDVLVAAHELTFGDDFTKETATDYLEISNNNVDKQFGVEPEESYMGDTMRGGFFVNHAFPNDGTQRESTHSWTEWNGTTVGTHEVKDGDLVEFFFYESEYMGDTYTWFTDAEENYSRTYSVCEGADLDLILRGFYAAEGYRCKDEEEFVNYSGASEIEGMQIYTVNMETGALTKVNGAVTDEDGEVTLSFDDAGTYAITAYGEDDYGMMVPIMTLTTVTVTPHEWSDWTIVKPTLEEKGSRTRTCSVCGKVETKEIPKLTEATVSVRLNAEAGKPAEMYKDLYVRSDYAYEAGFQKFDDMSTVTMADAIVAAHMAEYGESFKASASTEDIDAQLIIESDSFGYPWTNKIFNSTKYHTYWLNNDFSMSGIFDMAAADGDLVSVEMYESEDFSDTYIYLDKESYRNDKDGNVKVTVYAMLPDEDWNYEAAPVKDAKVVLKGADDNSVYEAETDEDGIAVFTPDNKGAYTAEVKETPYEYPWLPAVADVTVEENAHTFAVAKSDAIAEIRAYAEENKDKADSDKVEIAALKAENRIKDAETEDEVAAALAAGKSAINTLVQAQADAEAEAAAAAAAALSAAKTAANEELDAVKADDYVDAEAVESIVSEAKAAVEAAETPDAVEEALNAAKAQLADCKTKAEAKAEAEAAAAEAAARELAEAKKNARDQLNTIDTSVYVEPEKAIAIISTAKDAVADAETREEVEAAVATANSKLGELKTKAEAEAEEQAAAEAEAAAALSAAKTAAGEELDAVKADDYVDAEAVESIVSEAKTAIEAAETPDAVEEALNAAKAQIADCKTKAEAEAEAEAAAEAAAAKELAEAKKSARDELNAIDTSVYVEPEKAIAIVSTAKDAVADAESKAEIETAVAAANSKLGGLKTKAEAEAEEQAAAEEAAAAALSEAKTAANKELDAIKADDYVDAEAVENIVSEAKAAVDTAETPEAVEEALNAAKAQLADCKTKAEAEAEEQQKADEEAKQKDAEAARELKDAKTAAKAELNEIDASTYAEPEKAISVISTAKDAVDDAETKEAVSDAVADAKEKLGELKTKAEADAEAEEKAKEEAEAKAKEEAEAAEKALEDAKAAMTAALDAVDPDNYEGDDKAAVEQAVADARQAVADAKSVDDVLKAQDAFNTATAGVYTREQRASEQAKKDAEALEKEKADAIKAVREYVAGKLEGLTESAQDKAQIAELMAIFDIRDAADADSINKVKQAAFDRTDEIVVEDAENLKVKRLKAKAVKKHKIKLSWAKVREADGYQVQYKLKKAKKYKKLKTLTKNKLNSKKLKKGKKYIFRIRTYKVVEGQKIYGKWTQSRNIKCK